MSEEEKINQSTDDSTQSPENELVKGEPAVVNKELETINHQLQTEDMEVHHHPHVEKKNFKEYFLEFLMIFLAVTMGFFAENIRENYVEHKSAREYASLLIEDLTTDTGELNRAAHVLNLIITAGDSLGNLLSSDPKLIVGGKLYYYEYLSSTRWNLIHHDATLQQLKSSGALRYLGDTSLIRKIMNYEESVQIIYLGQNRLEPQKIENWSLVQKVFDQSYFNSLDSLSDFAINVSMSDERARRFINNNYPLLNYDKDLWQQLRNWAYCSSRNYRVGIQLFNAARFQAIIAIAALKKEYHLL